MCRWGLSLSCSRTGWQRLRKPQVWLYRFLILCHGVEISEINKVWSAGAIPNLWQCRHFLERDSDLKVFVHLHRSFDTNEQRRAAFQQVAAWGKNCWKCLQLNWSRGQLSMPMPSPNGHTLPNCFRFGKFIHSKELKETYKNFFFQKCQQKKAEKGTKVGLSDLRAARRKSFGRNRKSLPQSFGTDIQSGKKKVRLRWISQNFQRQHRHWLIFFLKCNDGNCLFVFVFLSFALSLSLSLTQWLHKLACTWKLWFAFLLWLCNMKLWRWVESRNFQAHWEDLRRLRSFSHTSGSQGFERRRRGGRLCDQAAVAVLLGSVRFLSSRCQCSSWPFWHSLRQQRFFKALCNSAKVWHSRKSFFKNRVGGRMFQTKRTKALRMQSVSSIHASRCVFLFLLCWFVQLWRQIVRRELQRYRNCSFV